MLEDRYLNDEQITQKALTVGIEEGSFGWFMARSIAQEASDYTLKVILDWLDKRLSVDGKGMFLTKYLELEDWKELRRLVK